MQKIKTWHINVDLIPLSSFIDDLINLNNVIDIVIPNTYNDNTGGLICNYYLS